MIPEELIDNLIQTMPEHQGPNLLEDREIPRYDYITFMERMMNNGEGEEESLDEDSHKAAAMNGRK